MEKSSGVPLTENNFIGDGLPIDSSGDYLVVRLVLIQHPLRLLPAPKSPPNLKVQRLKPRVLPQRHVWNWRLDAHEVCQAYRATSIRVSKEWLIIANLFQGPIDQLPLSEPDVFTPTPVIFKVV